MAAESRNGDQDAATVSQHFLGVPVGRRDHRLAAAEGVGERTGRDLCGLQVGSKINVGGGDELDQLVPFDEAVVKDDVFADSEIACQRSSLADTFLHARGQDSGA